MINSNPNAIFCQVFSLIFIDFYAPECYNSYVGFQFPERLVFEMNKTKKLVISALFASLVCVATMIIKIPSFQGGYVNLGDSIVLVCGWFLSPGYAFAAAAVGSALADLFAGYVLYAPVTFAIKGVMALIAHFVLKAISNKKGHFLSASVSAISAEVLMIAGYFVFEVFLYGAYASLMNVLANSVQAVAGIVVGILLYNVFRKSKLF